MARVATCLYLQLARFLVLVEMFLNDPNTADVASRTVARITLSFLWCMRTVYVLHIYAHFFSSFNRSPSRMI